MTERRSGRTTKQLAALPIGGWFVCYNTQQIDYARRLAFEVLRRDDIRFMTLDDFREYRWRGRPMAGLDMDHYAAEIAVGTEAYSSYREAWQHLKATRAGRD